MEFFSKSNYSRHKQDVNSLYHLHSLDFNDNMDYILSDRDKIISYGIKIVERIARGFSISDNACGCLTIEDLIQEGYVGLIYAADNLDVNIIKKSSNPSWAFESFLYKRIYGNIRREIDANRSSMRIPERKIREIRANGDAKLVKLFFDSMIKPIEDCDNSKGEYRQRLMNNNIRGNIDEVNSTFMNVYLLGLLNSCLDKNEATVINMLYGLDGERKKIYEIGKYLGLEYWSTYKTINDLKESAMLKLSNNIDNDFLRQFLN